MDKRLPQTMAVFFACGIVGVLALEGCRGPGNTSNEGDGAQNAGMGGGLGAMGMGGAGGMAVATGGAGGAASPMMGMPPAPNMGGAGGGMATAPPVVPPPAAMGDMPADVLALLSSRCAGCHAYGQSDPAGWGSVLDVSRMIDADIVVPGSPDESRMIDRVAVVGNMPPKGPRLTADEVDLLKGWITGLKRNADQPPSDDDILDMIAADQLALRDRSADFRYLSFAHYVGQGRSGAEMDGFRQVLTFALNSLSRRGALAELPTIDPGQSVFRVNLVDLGWNADVWDTITGFYPYCLKSDATAHEALYEQLDTEAPVVRGDWFLATAMRSPLYDQLLDLPATVDQLAAQLGIDINDDINHPGLVEPDNLVRVAFRRSGVNLHNRMVERHLGAAGQYLWLTYDFDSSQGDQDVLANPLGPAARDQQNFQNTFRNVSGEVIFSLPNGLQGFMIVDGAGRRIDEVSTRVARDPHRRDGIVRSAISCMGCHGGPGVVRPRDTDEVARYADTHIAEFLGRELDEISSTYPRVLQPDLFNLDASRYRAIAESAPGGAPPLTEGGYAAFITALGHYESNVGFRGAAAEFNQEFASLRDTVRANDPLNDALPDSPKAPLLLRDDFVCVWRDLVTKIRQNAEFCAETFTAIEVRESCD